MKDFQKISGIAAIVHAAAYCVGIGLYATTLHPILDADPGQYVAQLAAYKSPLYWWIFICYLVAGFCLVPVALALHRRVSAGAPNLMLTSTVLGCIWAGLIIGSGNLMLHDFGEVVKLYGIDPAQTETVWVALMTVENGIVSGNELIGGIWILLLSWAALRTDGLNKALNYLGLVIGVAGIVSIIPVFTEVAVMIFGLSMIVWFVWAGIVLLRHSSSPAI